MPTAPGDAAARPTQERRQRPRLRVEQRDRSRTAHRAREQSPSCRSSRSSRNPRSPFREACRWAHASRESSAWRPRAWGVLRVGNEPRALSGAGLTRFSWPRRWTRWRLLRPCPAARSHGQRGRDRFAHRFARERASRAGAGRCSGRRRPPRGERQQQTHQSLALIRCCSPDNN